MKRKYRVIAKYGMQTQIQIFHDKLSACEWMIERAEQGWEVSLEIWYS